MSENENPPSQGRSDEPGPTHCFEPPNQDRESDAASVFAVVLLLIVSIAIYGMAAYGVQSYFALLGVEFTSSASSGP